MKLLSGGYLLSGGAELLPDLFSMLEKEGIRVHGNPDIFTKEYATFGIDEARELRERASMKAVAGGGRIFIISAAGMTSEAQNALLKTLEEPSAEAIFFLLVPTPETLLPTLRSRMQSLLLSASKAYSPLKIDAKEFLDSSPVRRIAMLKSLLERDEEDRRDIGAIISFLSSLERTIASQKSKSKDGLPAQAGLHAIYLARKYILDKGALVKPLLEQVALLV